MARLTPAVARRELQHLSKLGLIKQKAVTRESKSKTTKQGKPAKRRTNAWVLDDTFPYLRSLTNMLVHTKPLRNDELLRRFQKAGKIKVIVVAGVFLQDEDSRLDLLVAGDKLSEAKVRNIMKEIEAEVGKELVYAAFKTEEFTYRLSIYDKLIRDVLDYDHETVMDRIGLSGTGR